MLSIIGFIDCTCREYNTGREGVPHLELKIQTHTKRIRLAKLPPSLTLLNYDLALSLDEKVFEPDITEIKNWTPDEASVFYFLFAVLATALAVPELLTSFYSISHYSTESFFSQFSYLL